MIGVTGGAHGQRSRIEQVADDVFAVQGIASTWTLLREGGEVTLVDAGYPGDLPAVIASIEQVGGSLGALSAVLLTHAHIDHLGAVPELLRRRRVPVLADARELPMLHGERREQATPADVLRRILDPRIAAWAVRIAAAGGLSHLVLPEAQALPSDGRVDVPGRPVPVPAPGHTSGHSLFLLPDAGTVLTGDLLITAHRITAHRGPQLLPAFFHHNLPALPAALEQLAGLDADAIVPGHGPARRGALRDMVEQALRGAPAALRR